MATFIALGITYIFLDLLFITLIAKKFFWEKLTQHLSKRTQIGPILIFYFIYSIGIYYLALAPGLSSNDVGLVLFNGALLGLVAYGTFELISYALFKDWPLNFVIIDICWGMFATLIASGIGYLTAQARF